MTTVEVCVGGMTAALWERENTLIFDCDWSRERRRETKELKSHGWILFPTDLPLSFISAFSDLEKTLKAVGRVSRDCHLQ